MTPAWLGQSILPLSSKPGDIGKDMRSPVVLFVLVSSLLGQTVGTKEAPATVVAGESWLNHIHRSFDETSMGKTGRLVPPASAPGEEMPRFQLGSSPGPASQPVTLRGSDLYR